MPETHLTPCPVADSHFPYVILHTWVANSPFPPTPAVPPVGNWQKPAVMGIDILEIRSNVLAEDMEDNWNDSPDCQGANLRGRSRWLRASRLLSLGRQPMETQSDPSFFWLIGCDRLSCTPG